jgi:glycosyltransferase involved in cell wall biosynthesis
MNILYHHRTASRDGQSTHIEEMIIALRSIGCTISLACPQVDTRDASGGSGGWVGTIKALLPKQLYELAELGYSWVAYKRLVAKIRESRPDVIYERYNLFLLAGVWAKRRFGLPLIVEVNAPMAQERRQYGGLAWPRLADWAEHYVWRNADFVLPVSQVLADYIVSKGVAADRVVVIPNGIREDQFANLPSVDTAKAGLNLTGKLVIGFTGFVREWDRLDRIVKWMASSDRFSNTHLLVIGDGPARAEIEQCALELGISDRVSFTGAVTREEVPALSMAFDIALQTALVPYASPLCLFEYLALSKAIVAPDQPNHHELLIDNVDSVLYDPNDDQGVERALDRVCGDADLRARISVEAGRVITSKKLTWLEHAKKIVSLASRAVAAKSASSTR